MAGLLGKNEKTQPVKHMTIDDDEDWASASDDDEVFTHRLSYAPSGRARCKRCSEPIPLGAVRIGTPIRWRQGVYFTSWMHTSCVRVRGAAAKVRRQLYIPSGVKRADVTATVKEITSTTVPECEKEAMEHDDEAFWEQPEAAAAESRRGTPAAMSADLLPFQEVGVGWMLKQEMSPVRGGILADEMGLGKTIQTIGLILSSLEINARRRGVKKGPTLIVTPASAMLQWKEEFEKFIRPEKNPLRISVYHGTGKACKLSKLTSADIVLTTYNTLEHGHRAVVEAAKIPCEFCGKKYLRRTLYSHQKFFCGPAAERSEKQALRDRKRQSIALAAAEKAKKTLRIGAQDKHQEASMPSLMNIYRDLMHDAGRRPLGRYETVGSKEQRNKVLKLTLFIVGHEPVEVSGPPDATVAWLKRQAGEAVGSSYRNVRIIRGGAFVTEHDATELSKIGVRTGDSLMAAVGAAAGRKLEAAVAEVKQEGGGKAAAARRSKPPPAKRARKGGAAAAKGRSKGSQVVSDDDSSDSGSDSADSSSESSSSESSSSEEVGAKRKRRTGNAKKPVGKGAAAAAKRAAEGLNDVLNYELSPLHCVSWNRLVLDEAHKIKGRVTGVAKAAYALKSEHRWCLTGTPLQNRVGELFSLVRFLRLEPYAFYGCSMKGCDCRSLDWQFGPMQRACVHCDHPCPRHFSFFNRDIVNPIQRYGSIGDGKRGMLRLRNEILQCVQLRRTKKMCAKDIGLPPLTVTIAHPSFDEREQDFYEALYKRCAAKFDGYVKKGTLLHNYAHIFELLARLRQACDHPYIVTTAEGQHQQQPAEVDDTCGICGEGVPDDDRSITLPSCGHRLHQDCCEQYVLTAPADSKRRGGTLPCPAFCCGKAFKPESVGGQPESEDDTKPAKGNKRKRAEEDEDSEDEEAAKEKAKKPAKRGKGKKVSVLDGVNKSNFLSSTKIEALMRGIQSQPPGAKSLVFSQFSGMLEIVEWRLARAGVRTTRLVGSMSVEERSKSLKSFRTNPDVRALLLSLRAGGEGLNLQNATYVYTLEPWWNPAVEMQAIQRAHRIGQCHAVQAVRFVVKGTIEERMLHLQEKKQLVFDGTIDADRGAMSKLSQEDLAFLFKR
eukprot:TRINITY_DN7724_c0_g2_i1.p1 TRINITY_DN7724_c0_g2~~TRINITY_DN7724_c0_g2_i1.p1  ORF type:complete len:1135 (+),score=368.36 TRINITY_DN7724_c0_g2_i1:72-3407(+)